MRGKAWWLDIHRYANNPAFWFSKAVRASECESDFHLGIKKPAFGRLLGGEFGLWLSKARNLAVVGFSHFLAPAGSTGRSPAADDLGILR